MSHRKLDSFEWTGEYKDHLFLQYKNVEFSQLCTFDLMRLLRSSVRSRTVSYSIEERKQMITDEQNPIVCKMLKKFLEEDIKFNNWHNRYDAALKRELGTRENLNPCQKRALNSRRRR